MNHKFTVANKLHKLNSNEYTKHNYYSIHTETLDEFIGSLEAPELSFVIRDEHNEDLLVNWDHGFGYGVATVTFLPVLVVVVIDGEHVNIIVQTSEREFKSGKVR